MWNIFSPFHLILRVFSSYVSRYYVLFIWPNQFFDFWKHAKSWISHFQNVSILEISFVVSTEFCVLPGRTNAIKFVWISICVGTWLLFFKFWVEEVLESNSYEYNPKSSTKLLKYGTKFLFFALWHGIILNFKIYFHDVRRYISWVASFGNAWTIWIYKNGHTFRSL